MIYIIPLTATIGWFWFVDMSMYDAALTTVGFAGGWYSLRFIILKNEELMANQVAIFLLLTCSYGTIVGLSAIVFRHLI